MIELVDIRKSYSSRKGRVDAIGGINLRIEAGEFVSIVGPSGCGKSTLLNMVAGFSPPSSGEVRVRNEVVRNIPKNLGYIFQRDTVLPWLSVSDNIALSQRYRGAQQAATKERVRELLRVGKLESFANSFPYQLSGGMRRRLALLMSLSCDPEILLLDEPFGALDTHTRTNLHQELINIWRTQRQTMVLVTHDLDEAVTLSDRVIVLSGPPSRILLDERIKIEHPRDVYRVRQTDAFSRHYKAIWSVLGEQFENAPINQ